MSNFISRDLLIGSLFGSMGFFLGTIFYERYHKRKILQEINDIKNDMEALRTESSNMKKTLRKSEFRDKSVRLSGIKDSNGVSESRRPSDARDEDHEIRRYRDGEESAVDEYLSAGSLSPQSRKGSWDLIEVPFSQCPEELIHEMDRLSKHAEESEAGHDVCVSTFKKIWEVRHEYRNNPEFLWRYARICYYMSFHGLKDSDNLDEKCPKTSEEFLSRGLGLAQKSIDLYTRYGKIPSASAYCWLVVLYGIVSQNAALNEKVAFAKEFKYWLDMAIAEYPDEWYFHLFLGRYFLALYNLTWIERKVAESLYGELPSATLADIENSLKKAYRLNQMGSFKVQYFLGECALLKGDLRTAIKFYDESAMVFRRTLMNAKKDDDEKKLFAELEQKIDKYSIYR